ncbi:hypothetical protein GLOIN_2v1509962 [Rhizophagus irregularis DAOM 181602=DAOM 197198]|uniref:Uncharacterized protein n=1 Tax=Rhizophagus irregularis (strain DAOM 181602 / DAOM 197198 / MUCL 43194) TaxID=747089 RepID=A0A2P4QUW5_RHIID|nr:hypothetical protein GLOIN_2v1509962 [Rhizophagus irregularis DAOM 181602=DAOM 197198]POG81338.1 hypothetical protein GLOIN_2v1509962 [Rhizophagus irregularis DAOM 181602=DAOM 197198]GET51616.1 hypothetical protein GLOIN_2v1509962 [Rhizophagus irregularis DAOM 181602=DAOM 197198]|eukprot:XP_025188204.1 hypothetical protein GLOIN_2v1509962 [Rhizophagus irregularis DAOM 181602=DAOM 197198]
MSPISLVFIFFFRSLCASLFSLLLIFFFFLGLFFTSVFTFFLTAFSVISSPLFSLSLLFIRSSFSSFLATLQLFQLFEHLNL